ncbi:hypothetical protein ACFWWA_16660 [Streptomyces goshikiensis]|uniref:hypothetical protein n=1 Tax=Streptomyces goshikiensis TaxID=1942 RepID=UPI0036527F89
MNTFAPAEINAAAHTARTAELTAEAAAWRLVRDSAVPTAPALPALPALRNRLGEALVSAGIRLMRPAHSGVHRPA